MKPEQEIFVKYWLVYAIFVHEGKVVLELIENTSADTIDRGDEEAADQILF